MTRSILLDKLQNRSFVFLASINPIKEELLMGQKPFHEYLIAGLGDGSLLLETVLAEIRRIVVPEKHQQEVQYAFSRACDACLAEVLSFLGVSQDELVRFEAPVAISEKLPRPFHGDLIAGMVDGTMAIPVVLARLEQVEVPKEHRLTVGAAFAQRLDALKNEAFMALEAG